MLKYKIAKLEDIAEAFRSLYAPAADGVGFVLQVEGAVPTDRLNEFRDNNVALKKEVDAFKAKYGDLDPEEYKRLKSIEDALKSGKIKGTDAEKILEERTAEMKREHDKALKKLQDENTSINGRLETLLINEAAVNAGLEKGLRATAKDDLAARARGTFKLVDGKVVAFGADGKEMFGREGQPMQIGEWIDTTLKNAPHLFEPSNGTGGKGNQGGAGGAGGNVNPWKKETFNLTAQGQIFKTNPDLAKRYMAEAGVAA